jgi:hypothetical protein
MFIDIRRRERAMSPRFITDLIVLLGGGALLASSRSVGSSPASRGTSS